MSSSIRTMLSDPRFLVEDYKTEDLFDFTVHANSLKQKIENIPNKSLLGIVGSYGMGKSTLLEQVHNQLNNADILWVHFDAWKYPERTNLWEGFVLDFVRQVTPKSFDKTLKIIDGTSSDVAKKLTKAGGALLNTQVPGTGALASKLADFFTTSPAKRVFQIQDIFEDVLKKKEVKDKQIYITIEDADRSGDAGIYFIETLSHFLRSSEFENKIKAFVPIAGKSFSEKRDSYIKALDFVEFFNITSRDFTKFVEKVFSSELTSNDVHKDHLVEWLQRLVAKYGLSFRDIKFIIRNSEDRYRALQVVGHTPDARIVLILESCRYMDDTNSNNKLSFHENITRDRYIHRNTDPHLLLLAIRQHTDVSNMAEIVNQPHNGRTPFAQAINIVDNQSVFTNNQHPVQDNDKYILPRYYID